MSEGEHKWFMRNVRGGYLVVEGCFHCGARSSFFSTEPVPPIDEYHQGDHFWAYMGSFQAAKFDLECSHCGQIIDLSDVNALMLSTCRDEGCEVGRLVRQHGGTAVYVALCGDNSHETGNCVSPSGIAALNEYFNQEIDIPDKKVVVVPCKLCNNIDRCGGIMIADTGLTEMY